MESEQLLQDKNLKPTPWSYDRSLRFGDLDDGTDFLGPNGTLAGFVRTVNENEPKLTRNQATGTPEYTAWSYEHWHLEYAQAIILTIEENGQTRKEVFDNDDAEIKPQGTKDNPVVTATSNNPKSINSQNFLDALAKEKTLQIRIKNGFFYTNSQGNKTKYEVKAEDFWGSYKKVFMLTQKTRWDNGGSLKLDEKAIALSPARNYFSKNSQYSNDYLYTLFGVDVQKLLNEDTALRADSENAGKKLLTFDSFDTGEKANITSVFRKQIVDANEFSPIPLNYIKDDLNKRPIYKDFTEGPDRATGDAERFGVYTYGRRWQDILWAGYFYLKDVDLTNNQVVYKFNENNVDAQVNKAKPGYVQSITELSITNPTIASVRTATAFDLGNSYNILQLGSLADQDRTKIEASLKANNNERFSLTFSRIRLVIGAFPLTNPDANGIKNDKAADVLFNDNLSKLVYGKTRAQIAAGDETTTNYFSAKAVAFRAALYAAVNWQQYARQNNDSLVAYLGMIPPDATIGGTDENQPEVPKTIRPIRSQLNVRNVFLFDPSQKTITGISPTSSNDQDNQKVANQNTNNVEEEFKSAAYNVAKAEMKKILDAENIPMDQKVTWIWIAPKKDKPVPRERNAIDNLEKTLNSLDPRLDIHFRVEENQANHDRLTRNGTGFNVAGKWSNGYDGIAHREKSIFLSFFSRALDGKGENAWIAKVFLEITKVSQDLDRFIKELNANPNSNRTKAIKIDLSKPISSVASWKNIPNKDWAFTPDNVLNAGQFSLMGSFFLQYQNKHTNGELIALAKEMAQAVGFIPGRKQGSVLLPRLTPILQAVNKGRILPVSTTGILWVQDLALSQAALDAMKTEGGQGN